VDLGEQGLLAGVLELVTQLAYAVEMEDASARHHEHDRG